MAPACDYGRSGPTYDFVADQTHDGKTFRMLCVIDEFTMGEPGDQLGPKAGATDVIDVLADLLILRGVPNHIRSDNGPESIAEALRN